ncbi:CHAT domain-containing protein [uncultured Dysgonomonas sp.]|uniref:CHAT domain-containing protein n=1 Tax=uncultured Dysgonomonas sp. TaxID=206096 RepID=A0A212K7K3_9BACT|nr:CHAT domain-containing protein [uncultured Dysgonomonas sp.]SBW07680.1 exported hypothetical protein [uncultured Dysgonomonas sp.]
MICNNVVLRGCIYLLFTLFSFTAIAQNTNLNNPEILEQVITLNSEIQQIYSQGNYQEALGKVAETEKFMNGKLSRGNILGSSILLLKARIYRDLSLDAEGLTIINQLIKDIDFIGFPKEILGDMSAEDKDETDGIVRDIKATIYTIGGEFLSHLDRTSEAYDYYKKAAGYAQLLKGDAYISYALILQSIGNMQREEGLLLEAKKNTLQALEISEQLEKPSGRHTAGILNTLGVINRDLNDFEKAEEYYRRALKIYENAGMKNSDNYALALFNLSGIYSVRNDEEKAIELTLESKQIIKNTVGRESGMYLKILNDEAITYLNRSDYEKALKPVIEAEDIAQKVYGKQHSEYADILMSLGKVYQKTGREIEGLEHAKKAVEIYKKTELYNTPAYYKALNNLAEAYIGAENPGFVQVYDELAQYYSGMSKTDAERLRNDAAFYDFMSDMAIVSYAMDNHKEASNLAEMAVDGLNRIYGSDYHSVLSAYEILALASCGNKNYKMAITAVEHLVNGIKKNVQTQFLYLTEQEREFLWGRIRSSLDAVYAVANGMAQENLHSDTYADLLYDIALFSKGILLNSTIEFEKIITNSNNTQLLKDYKDYKELKSQLDKIYTLPLNQRENPELLESRLQSLEKKLLAQSKEFGDYTSYLKIDHNDVFNNLESDNDIVIEFVRGDGGAHNESIYGAVMYCKGWKNPMYFSLFTEKELLNLTVNDKTLEEILSTGNMEDLNALYSDHRLYDMVWSRLHDDFYMKNNIYFSCDGLLHQIAIENLTAQNNVRLSEMCNMRRVSSTRELALRKDAPLNKTAAIYGGIDYNTNTEAMEYLAEVTHTRGTPDYLSLPEDIKFAAWRYLNGTRLEAESVQSRLKDTGFDITFRTGEEALEETFKQLSGKQTQIIHIATHGFFIPEKENKNELKLTFGQDYRSKRLSESLYRSGLVFSGANNYWLNSGSFPVNIDNGILTAKEITEMDLRGTDLVVLSACQTGLGATTHDGVFGLQRALKNAGVNTLLVSLWNVNDEATQVMMSEFYKALNAGHNKSAAFDMAKNELKDKVFTIRNKEYKGSDSYFWASFVMIDGH